MTPTRALLFLALVLATGCDEHELICNAIAGSMGQHDGFDAPGEAGAPRWGLLEATPETLRVRRSWSSLSDEEKEQVVQAFLLLKNTTVESGDPGSARADYDSLCEATGQAPYERNLYDYYVEAHANAFLSMMTPVQGMDNMSHMGPQFLPWHRYLLLRIEADMAEAIGDPDFALPYWDWTDCYTDDGDPNTCAPLFEADFLGSAGGCDDESNEVTDGIFARGLTVNVYSVPGEIGFDPEYFVCGAHTVRRAVGCSEDVTGPAGEEDIAGVFDRVVYDAAPYDACGTDEAVSFRQYLEGFTLDSTTPTCVGAGCEMHGRGHVYVGGDMFDTTTNPNDPVFFLHHAQVDRIWAAWQQANVATGSEERMEDAGNPEYPTANKGGLFVWPDVDADEMFDYEAQGYTYDSLPTP